MDLTQFYPAVEKAEARIRLAENLDLTELNDPDFFITNQ